MESAIFMIEGGKPLEMVKEHIAERLRVKAVARALAAELGVDDIYTNRSTGILSGVCFKGKLHPEFTKARGREGVSYPKKGTEWDKRIKAQVGHKEVSGWIAKEFGIPCGIRYKGDNCNGSKMIGSPFNECGFLYLGESGPYAMWTPDVPAEVVKTEADGYEVEEPAKSFVLEFDGCRRIEKEEWEILVLQNKLEQRQAS
ncbi:MAG TPA: hypothetical protein DCZ63_08585 [Geobacter sp.]|nr:hypothetical protein [Geobacter sp.]